MFVRAMIILKRMEVIMYELKGLLVMLRERNIKLGFGSEIVYESLLKHLAESMMFLPSGTELQEKESTYYNFRSCLFLVERTVDKKNKEIIEQILNSESLFELLHTYCEQIAVLFRDYFGIVGNMDYNQQKKVVDKFNILRMSFSRLWFEVQQILLKDANIIDLAKCKQKTISGKFLGRSVVTLKEREYTTNYDILSCRCLDTSDLHTYQDREIIVSYEIKVGDILGVSVGDATTYVCDVNLGDTFILSQYVMAKFLWNISFPFDKMLGLNAYSFFPMIPLDKLDDDNEFVILNKVRPNAVVILESYFESYQNGDYCRVKAFSNYYEIPVFLAKDGVLQRLN